MIKTKIPKPGTARKVDAIILAGGSIGRRELFPKALLELDGETLLERQIEWLSPHVNRIIVTCTEQEAKQIKKYHPELKVHFATTSGLPGSAGSLKNAISLVNTDNFLVVNVDDVTDIDIRSLIQFGTNSVCVSNPRLNYGIIEIEQGQVKNLREKPLLTGLWVNCGVYFLNKAIAEKLPRKGSLAKDVLPYINLRAYKHFGTWQPIWKHHLRTI
jgi:NDP-sugar pyrophosphorylase family protein